MIFIQFLLFFLPFVIVPFGSSQYEIPKVVIGMFCIDAAALYMFFKHKLSVNLFSKSQFIITVFFVLITLYDLIFLQTPLSFFGNKVRMQGILLFWHLLVLAVISAQIQYKKLPWFWYTVILLFSCISGLLFGNPSNRSVGTLGEPNALAAWFIFLWPFVLFANDIPSKYKRYVQISAATVALSVIFLTGSRSGFIALAIQCVFILLLKFSKNLSLTLVVSIALVGCSYILPNFQNNVYENREVIWHSAAVSGLTHPFLGNGFGNIQFSLRNVITKEHNLMIGYIVDSSHNILLDFWIQGGVIGLSLFVTLVSLSFANFYRSKHWFELMLLLGLLTMFSFNPLSVVSLVQLWWLIGQSFSFQKTSYCT